MIRYEVSLVSGPGSGLAKAPVTTPAPTTKLPGPIAPLIGSGISLMRVWVMVRVAMGVRVWVMVGMKVRRACKSPGHHTRAPSHP